MLILFRKEIGSFLNSLIGYIVITVFLLINGLFLWVFQSDFNILDFGFASLDGLFMVAPFVFLFLIPAITMRSFAEEQKSGTIEMLLTKPLTDLEIILAKYFAAVVLVVFSVLPTLIYFYSVYQLGMPKGNLDIGGILGSYFGLIFLGATFAAIGLFASSVTNNSIIAFILAVSVSLFAYIGFDFIYSLDMFGSVDLFVKSLGINAHYLSMSRGVVDSRDLIYFISLIVFFVLLTKLSLESRKW